MTKLPSILLSLTESSDHPPPGRCPHLWPAEAVDGEFEEGSSEGLRLCPFALQVYLDTGVSRQPLEVRAGVMAEILNQVEVSPCRCPHPGPAGGASPKPLSLSAGAAATTDRGVHRPASHSPGPGA